jgi:two-component system response regulator VicR
MKPVLTTGDVASYCHVSLPTVFRWIRNGYLPAYTLPNGHHRILPEEFRAFLERHGMPIRDAVFPREHGGKRILVVGGDAETVEVITETLKQGLEPFEVKCCSGAFDAGVLMTSFRPQLVVLDLMTVGSGFRAFEVLQRIQAYPATADTRTLVLASCSESGEAEHAVSLGADATLGRPLSSRDFLAKVQELLARGSRANSNR